MFPKPSNTLQFLGLSVGAAVLSFWSVTPAAKTEGFVRVDSAGRSRVVNVHPSFSPGDPCYLVEGKWICQADYA